MILYLIGQNKSSKSKNDKKTSSFDRIYHFTWQLNMSESTKENLCRDLSQLMTEEKFSDVVLVTKEGTRIPAHRVILVRCQYFRAMFCGGMKEARETEVKLEVEEDVLRLILGYIYTGNVELGHLDVKLFF